ncbi:GntR family transcriptional regulator [Desulfospira joergensenii]|uniref:GntR family transcriptional regulator n=1 Tax=Desulfospira joergensenii TaxID=53329 RepID=UPI0003B441E4|nr:FCD domain-containing protein [Desulfospira joergensenii]
MIYPVIQALEIVALSSAAPFLIEQDFNQMTRANDRFKKALENHDPLEASRADDEFHDVFIRRSENIHLIHILDSLKIRSRRLEVCYFKEEDGNLFSPARSSIEEHISLVSALKTHDLPQAKQILHSNWEKSLKRFRATAKSPDNDSEKKRNSND